MITTRKTKDDKDAALSDPLLIPAPETSSTQRAALAKTEMIEKWKKKFTSGLRSTSKAAT